MRCYVVVAHAHNAAPLSDLPCYDFIRETRVDMTLPNKRHATAKTVLPKATNFPKWPLAYSFLLTDGSHVKVNVHPRMHIFSSVWVRMNLKLIFPMASVSYDISLLLQPLLKTIVQNVKHRMRETHHLAPGSHWTQRRFHAT